VHGRRLTTLLPALALALLASAGGTTAAAAAPAPPSGEERALLKAINAARSAHRLPALRPADTLARPARAHSASLARLGRLEHEGANRAPFWKRLVQAGYPSSRPMAENLAMVPGCGGATAREAVRLWLGSPGHRANLLSPRYRWVGVGAALSGPCEQVVYTADFGG
jgi:uncharacterized protein YkwD